MTTCIRVYSEYRENDAEQEAKELLAYMRELIHSIPKHVENHSGVRIIFWFDS